MGVLAASHIRGHQAIWSPPNRPAHKRSTTGTKTAGASMVRGQLHTTRPSFAPQVHRDERSMCMFSIDLGARYTMPARRHAVGLAHVSVLPPDKEAHRLVTGDLCERWVIGQEEQQLLEVGLGPAGSGRSCPSPCYTGSCSSKREIGAFV